MKCPRSKEAAGKRSRTGLRPMAVRRGLALSDQPKTAASNQHCARRPRGKQNAGQFVPAGGKKLPIKENDK